MVAPALPDIQRELRASTTTVTFVLTSFLLTASVATPILGRLGDMFGKKRILVLTLAVFGIGSVISAMAHSIGPLIAGRAISGAAGAVFPLSFGIIRDEFPRRRVATGIGLISATFGIGGGAGLVLSGVIVDQLSFEWIFWLCAAATAVAVAATHLLVPESPEKRPARIDWAGAALLSAGLAALLIAISEGGTWGWESTQTIGLFAVAVAVLCGWAAFEARVPEPLVDMAMMARRAVLTTNLTTFLVGFGMFGSYVLIPKFVQIPASTGYGFGASVTQSGIYLLPSALVMLFAGPFSGWLGGRRGAKLPMLVGTATCSLSFAFLAAEHSSAASIYVGTSLMGLGIGFAFAAMANLIVEAVEPHETGVATGINTIMRTIGGSLGAQVAASVVAGHTLASGQPAESGFTAAFVVSAIAICFAFLVAAAIPARGSAQARETYSPLRVSTRTVSPSSTKSGT
jgi:EmrB/QacA subfamily drug resistance transporter